MNLVESQLWNEVDWRGKYVGVVPRTGRSGEVGSQPRPPRDEDTKQDTFSYHNNHFCVFSTRAILDTSLIRTPLIKTPH